MKLVDSMLELIGNTPIKKLNVVTKGLDVNVWVKLEYLNPSGSLKDRIALEMIEDAERSGALKKGDTIIESSSGNTAMALSFVGAIKGYRRVIFMADVMAKEKVEMIKRYGSEIRIVEFGEAGKDASVHGAYVEIPGRIKCKEMEESEPNVWWARQFSNPANYRGQMKLGREIFAQLGNKIDAFVTSVGTGGTVFGVGQVLKEQIPNIKIVAVEPAGIFDHMTLSNFQIIPGVAGGILKEISDSGVVDRLVKVEDEEAVEMYRRLCKEEGLFVGGSAGANVLTAIKIAKEMGKGSTVVTVLPDRADRYITSEHFIT